MSEDLTKPRSVRLEAKSALSQVVVNARQGVGLAELAPTGVWKLAVRIGGAASIA